MKTKADFPLHTRAKLVLPIILAAFFPLFFCFEALAGVSNNNYANAQALSGSSGTVFGSNVGFTKELAEPDHAGNPGGASAWYSWTAPASGWYTVDTFGSNFDTLLAVYTGTSLGSLSAVVAIDDAPDSMQSQVAFNATAGTTYLIAVDGYNGATGSSVLNYQPSPLVALNVFASPDTGGTVTGSGTFQVGSSQTITATAKAGWQFTIWDDGNTENPRPIVIPNRNSFYTAIFKQLPITSNDFFANALEIANSSGTVTNTNVGFTKEPGEPSHAGNMGGSSAWYAWTAPASGPVTFDTFGSNFDTLFAVYTGNSVGGLVPVGSSNDSNGTKQSQVAFDAVGGTKYMIAVDGFNGASGTIILNWLQKFRLDVLASPLEGGTVSGSGTYLVNSSQKIFADAAEGWIFSSWDDGNTKNPRIVTVSLNGNNTYTAQFSQLAALNVVANPVAGGSPLGSGTFIADTYQQIAVTENPGWIFTGWQDGNNQNPRTVYLPLTGTTYTASFGPQVNDGNDNFANGKLITGTKTSGSVSDSNRGFTAESGEPAHAGHTAVGSAWYSWTPAFDGWVTFDTFGSSFDTVLAVYTGTSVNALTLVAGAANDDANANTSGSQVAFSAVAGVTYHLAVDGVGRATGIIVLNYQQTAVLTVLAQPPLGGTVTGSGTFLVGSTQQITAAANSGWVFTGWNDGSTENPRTVTVAGGATYIANFSQAAELKVQANPANGGTVVGSGTFAVASSQTISAIPASGWVFTKWNDGNTQNPRTVTVPAGGATYTASFSPGAALSVQADPVNGGTVAGGGTFVVGSIHQIRASANSGWIFTGWNDGNTQNPRMVTVPASGAAYTASFSPGAALTVQANPANGGTVSGGGTFIVDSSRQISATARYGWAFTGWNDGNTENPRTVHVPAGGVAYTASFSQAIASLNVQANPTNGGTVAGSGTFQVGSSQTISATANPGWYFVGWSDNNTQNPRALTIQPVGATYVAKFAPLRSQWKGAYYGIFDEKATGFVKVSISANGSFSASMDMAGRKYSLRGVFDEFGSNISWFPNTPYLLALQMGATRGEMLGTLSLTNPADVTATFGISRSMIDSHGNTATAPFKGTYTYLLQPDSHQSNAPKGYGFGSFTVDKNGAIRMSGKLADGTALTQSTALTQNSSWPMYVPIYKQSNSTGFVVGMVNFRDNPESDLDGVLHWFKPLLLDKLYPFGFTANPTLIGSRYLAPAKGSRVLSYHDGNGNTNFGITFPGDPSVSTVKILSWGTDNGFVNTNPYDPFKMKITTSSGLFSGSFFDTSSQNSKPYSGAFLQKANIGGGYFIGAGSGTGAVEVSESQAPL